MSIRKAQELWCDGCAEWLPLETDYMADIWPALKRKGWTRGKGKHYCPDCSLRRAERGAE